MAEKPHPIRPHGEIEELAPGLWSVTGSLPFPLRRNMTIYRLPDGGLLLHSVVAMNDAGMAALERLGRPELCIVPSSGHRMDAPFYRRRYPRLKMVCPADARARVEKAVPVDATCEDTLPREGVRIHPLGGIRTGELGYEVSIPGGKALLFCDLLANSDYAPTLGGALMRTITGGLGDRRLGVARIVRLTLVRDRAATRAALGNIAAIPDLRLISVAHGRPLRAGCGDALREAAAAL
jgi:hypothetical protein